ncbi:MAG: hypothetical protein HY730_05900 [Candidatus Tectomicrobia bacterium]|uniref:Uncharacterized protein n=1 Tax=Tectimicrobiota bacterium TaxID=2528274 RepID=A0A933GM58_UNCTE|nr:hypothetical protein [Candidatus Tectomicrobia bacterium]
MACSRKMGKIVLNIRKDFAHILPCLKVKLAETGSLIAGIRGKPDLVY